MKKDSEYDKFDRLTSGLLKVPHAEVKERLENEKQAKRRKKSKVSSASREADDR